MSDTNQKSKKTWFEKKLEGLDTKIEPWHKWKEENKRTAKILAGIVTLIIIPLTINKIKESILSNSEECQGWVATKDIDFQKLKGKFHFSDSAGRGFLIVFLKKRKQKDKYVYIFQIGDNQAYQGKANYFTSKKNKRAYLVFDSIPKQYQNQFRYLYRRFYLYTDCIGSVCLSNARQKEDLDVSGANICFFKKIIKP